MTSVAYSVAKVVPITPLLLGIQVLIKGLQLQWWGTPSGRESPAFAHRNHIAQVQFSLGSSGAGFTPYSAGRRGIRNDASVGIQVRSCPLNAQAPIGLGKWKSITPGLFVVIYQIVLFL